MEVQNQKKLREKFIKSGVKMIGPETIFFSKDTKIGNNVTIEPYVIIGSKVKIGNNVIIKSFSHLESCNCLLYTSPSPRDATLSRMPSSA